jgi:hypothetical protein
MPAGVNRGSLVCRSTNSSVVEVENGRLRIPPTIQAWLEIANATTQTEGVASKKRPEEGCQARGQLWIGKTMIVSTRNGRLFLQESKVGIQL